jgi:hypothetical protein
MRRIRRADRAKEVPAVPQVNLTQICQAQVDLVHQRGGLKRLAGAFAPHVFPRHPPQMGLHERREGLQRSLVTGFPGPKERRDLVKRRVPGGGTAHLRSDLPRILTGC